MAPLLATVAGRTRGQRVPGISAVLAMRAMR